MNAYTLLHLLNFLAQSVYVYTVSIYLNHNLCNKKVFYHNVCN